MFISRGSKKWYDGLATLDKLNVLVDMIGEFARFPGRYGIGARRAQAIRELRNLYPSFLANEYPGLLKNAKAKIGRVIREAVADQEKNIALAESRKVRELDYLKFMTRRYPRDIAKTKTYVDKQLKKIDARIKAFRKRIEEIQAGDHGRSGSDHDLQELQRITGRVVAVLKKEGVVLTAKKPLAPVKELTLVQKPALAENSLDLRSCKWRKRGNKLWPNKRFAGVHSLNVWVRSSGTGLLRIVSADSYHGWNAVFDASFVVPIKKRRTNFYVADITSTGVRKLAPSL